MAGIVEEDGLPFNANFIVWEGGTFSGAHVTKMVECEPSSNIITSHILPTTDAFVASEIFYQRKSPVSQVQPIESPLIESSHSGMVPGRSSLNSEDDAKNIESGMDIDNFAVAALDSIRNTDKCVRSEREKTATLLRQCSSWTHLDDTEGNRALVGEQSELKYPLVYAIFNS